MFDSKEYKYFIVVTLEDGEKAGDQVFFNSLRFRAWKKEGQIYLERIQILFLMSTNLIFQ